MIRPEKPLRGSIYIVATPFMTFKVGEKVKLVGDIDSNIPAFESTTTFNRHFLNWGQVKPAHDGVVVKVGDYYVVTIPHLSFEDGELVRLEVDEHSVAPGFRSVKTNILHFLNWRQVKPAHDYPRGDQTPDVYRPATHIEDQW